jgi:hypothetical protein
LAPGKVSALLVEIAVWALRVVGAGTAADRLLLGTSAVTGWAAPAAASTVMGLRRVCAEVRYLGSYPRGGERPSAGTRSRDSADAAFRGLAGLGAGHRKRHDGLALR